MPIRCVLRAFEKRSDGVAGEWTVADIDAKTLAAKFGILDPGAWFGLSHPIGPAQVQAVQPLVDTPMDLDAYDYFLEYDDSSGIRRAGWNAEPVRTDSK
jgi:hypothetical protein